MSEPAVTATSAEHEVLQQGFDAPSYNSELNIPSDFSSVPNIGEDNIGDLMGRLAAYISFLEYKVSLSEIDYENWNNHYELEKKKILLTLNPERRDLMEARAEVQLEAIINVVAEKRAVYNLMKSMLEGKKRIADALSRDLSRRNLVFQMSRGA